MNTKQAIYEIAVTLLNNNENPTQADVTKAVSVAAKTVASCGHVVDNDLTGIVNEIVDTFKSNKEVA